MTTTQLPFRVKPERRIRVMTPSQTNKMHELAMDLKEEAECLLSADFNDFDSATDRILALAGQFQRHRDAIRDAIKKKDMVDA